MLAELMCGPIDKSTPPLPLSEAKKMLGEVAGWTLGKSEITREFTFKDFATAMQFVNKVADLANREDHHPDVHISYSKVKLDLSTHKIGGLSMNDFILAAKINRI
jgi:4a-hydroxytetrahydrobiopterin dehydratase